MEAALSVESDSALLSIIALKGSVVMKEMNETSAFRERKTQKLSSYSFEMFWMLSREFKELFIDKFPS